MTVSQNNPLNLAWRPQDKWEGLANPPSSGRWCVFIDPKYAFRAYTKEFQNYLKAGHDTVPKFIKVWSETDQDPYIVNVLRWGHFDASQVLTIADAPALFRAMCRQEDGADPYPDSIIAEGIAMALNTSKSAPVTVSPTTAVAGAGGIAYAVTSLMVGVFHDFAHVDITADRQVALALVVGVLIHRFFPKGESQ